MESINSALYITGWALIAIGIISIMGGVYIILRKDSQKGIDGPFHKFVFDGTYHYQVYGRVWRKAPISYICLLVGLILYFTGRFANFGWPYSRIEGSKESWANHCKGLVRWNTHSSLIARPIVSTRNQTSRCLCLNSFHKNTILYFKKGYDISKQTIISEVKTWRI